MSRMPMLLVLTVALPLHAATAQASAEGVWTKDTKGWAHHVPSGFGCPPDLLMRHNGSSAGTMTLQNVIVGSDRQPAGDRVGCEYEAGRGSWASVEITRLRPNETVATHYEAVRARIKARFPEIMRQSDGIGLRPKSPTSGDTFTVAYYNARTGDLQGSVTAVGGNVGGWMLTLIQFNHDKEAYDLQVAALTNWQRLANARAQR